MSRDDWITCPDPQPMLQFLIRMRWADDRRLRLFGIACSMRPNSAIPSRSQADLIDLALCLADGRLLEREVRSAKGRYCHPPMIYLLSTAAEAAFDLSVAIARTKGHPSSQTYGVERSAQAELVRELWGDPFDPIELPVHWATWERGLIPALAQGIYADRTFGRLGILADALEEAGQGEAIRDHFRHGCARMRGCWALDLCRQLSG